LLKRRAPIVLPYSILLGVQRTLFGHLFLKFFYLFICHGKKQYNSLHNEGYQSYVSRYTHTYSVAYLKTWGDDNCKPLLYLTKCKASRGQAGRQSRGRAGLDCMQATTSPAPLIATGGACRQGLASQIVR
jgi:hypothetical protein